MKIIAIIPARGGSKGISRKNVRLIGDKPMLAWNIEAARKSKYIDSVYISTDDTEIKEVASKYGANVIDRPKNIAGDTASSESSLCHSLKILSDQGIKPDLLVFMQCTSPLTSSEDIDEAVRKLLDTNADSCLTVTDFHYFIWKEDLKGEAKGINHDKSYRPRRQDRDSQYVENGAVYVMNVRGFLKEKHRFFGKTVISVMPRERSFEVDELIDLHIVEAMLEV